jgi:Winged helix-turn helix
MDQRMQFIADHQRGLYVMTELCARYGISRKTGYKWLARYQATGAQGLVASSPPSSKIDLRALIPHVRSPRDGLELMTSAPVLRGHQRPRRHTEGCARSQCPGSNTATNVCERAPPRGLTVRRFATPEQLAQRSP